MDTMLTEFGLHISQAASVQVRFNVLYLNILTKTMLKDDERDRIMNWGANIQDIEEAIQNIIPVSSTYGSGMEDIYTTAQQIYFGGEDLSKG